MDWIPNSSSRRAPSFKPVALLVAIGVIFYLSLQFLHPKQIKKLKFDWEKDWRPFQPFVINRDPSFDVQEEMDTLNREKVKPDDPRLVALIRNYYIEPPSDNRYTLLEPHKRDSSLGQAKFIDGVLENNENGFFVDIGAHNGEYQSNTLFFERIRHWSGILIEPQPKLYKELKTKNRKAYTLNACVCANQDWPSTVQFKATSFYGGIAASNDHGDNIINVQCFPFYSILLAMNQTHVDYFSLNVGGEGILDTIPWNSVNIRTFSIGYNMFNGKDEALIKYMGQRGYEWVVTMDSVTAHDCIFKKRNL